MNKLPLYLKFMVITFYVIIGSALIFIFFKYVFGWVSPFIFAAIFALMIEPAVKFLTDKCKIPRKLGSFITIIVVSTAIGFLLFLIVNSILNEFMQMTEHLPEYASAIPTTIDSVSFILRNYMNSLPQAVVNMINTAINSLSGEIVQLLMQIPRTLISISTAFVTFLPSALIFFVVFMVSSYFISSDRPNINAFIYDQFPNKVVSIMRITKGHLILTLMKFLRAQLILISITFLELYLGFVFIGLNYALTLAGLIAIIDALPILGTGMILIPWSLVALIMGNYTLSVSLIIMYAVILFVRQILEPKIIGSSIGLYPLVTLITMYIGLKTIGFWGIFILPILIITLRYLQLNGYINLWNESTIHKDPVKTKNTIKK